jgi:Family of unknown function (DUF6494)
MNEDILNMSLRKFLKKVGISAQRGIEEAVREALAAGTLKGDEKLAAKARVSLGGTNLDLVIEGEIELE